MSWQVFHRAKITLIGVRGWTPPSQQARSKANFFKTLKVEEVYLKAYQTLEEAAANIGGFTLKVYNIKRLHSSLGYLSPVEFETLQREKLALTLVC